MLINLLYQYNIIISDGSVNPHHKKLAKKYPDIFEQILHATSFCSEKATWCERIFCITNNIQSIPLCEKCKNVIQYNPSKRYNRFCSTKCSTSDSMTKNKYKQTCLERYGVENPRRSKDIQKKIKQTNLKRYGVDNPFKSNEVRNRIKQTNIKKYGVEHPAQSQEIKEKMKQTSLERYDVEYPWQLEEIREKSKQSWLERYGVDNPFKSKKIKEKSKQTMLERYGVERALQSIKPKNKYKQTSLERYGVENYTQKHMVETLSLLKDYGWLYNQYIGNIKSAMQIGKEINVGDPTIGRYLKHHNIVIRHINGFSFKCIQWLESIMREQNIFIQHAQNGGEYRIPKTKLHVDGYCKETNTIYEFHGNLFHGNPKIFKSYENCHPFNPNITAGELYQKTVEREDLIKSLGYNLVAIWESEKRHLEWDAWSNQVSEDIEPEQLITM
ncbi:MAG: DUF7487 domain-containing protein [Nitrosopumilaceae archaeon]